MKHKVLANGMQILLAPMPSAEVTIAVAIKLGTRYEKADSAGISHFCEHAIAASGTERFPTETLLNRAMDSVGGEFNGFTSRDIVMIHLTAAKQKMNAGIELLSDMLLHPILTDANVEIARKIIVSEFESMLDDHDYVIFDMRDKIMFASSSLATDTATELANSKKFKPWQIRRHCKKLVRPNRMIIAISGDFDEEKALESIEREFGELKRGLPQKFKAHFIDQFSPRFALKAKNANHISLSMGFPIFGYDDERRYCLYFLSNMLADRPSSILTRILRSEQGLVYSVNSSIWQWSDVGNFNINADTGRRANFFRIFELILSELNKLKKKLADKEEFEISRENLKARAKKHFSDPEYVAKFYAGQIATCGRAISLREHLRQLNSVRRVDIRRVANDALDFNRISLAAIGRVFEKDEERIKKIITEKAHEVFIS